MLFSAIFCYSGHLDFLVRLKGGATLCYFLLFSAQNIVLCALWHAVVSSTPLQGAVAILPKHQGCLRVREGGVIGPCVLIFKKM